MTGFYGPAISLTVTSSKFLSSISQELQMLRRSLTPYSNSNLLALLIRHYRIIKCLDFEEFSFWSRTIGPSFIRVKHYYFTQLRAKAAAKVAAPQLVLYNNSTIVFICAYAFRAFLHRSVAKYGGYKLTYQCRK